MDVRPFLCRFFPLYHERVSPIFCLFPPPMASSSRSLPLPFGEINGSLLLWRGQRRLPPHPGRHSQVDDFPSLFPSETPLVMLARSRLCCTQILCLQRSIAACPAFFSDIQKKGWSFPFLFPDQHLAFVSPTRERYAPSLLHALFLLPPLPSGTESLRVSWACFFFLMVTGQDCSFLFFPLPLELAL